MVQSDFKKFKGIRVMMTMLKFVRNNIVIKTHPYKDPYISIQVFYRQ